MRQLATIDTIAAINSHNNADTLELAVIKGWQVIVRKGEFHPGEKVVFCEIDSWIPTEIAPFLSKGQEPRVYEGIKGERLRTVKLRGEISQGLILPLSVLNASIDEESNIAHGVFKTQDEEFEFHIPLVEGYNVSDVLNIIKWEPTIPAQLQGQVEGNFPSFVCKTDQNRIQNCYSDMAYLNNHQHGGIDWVIEEKMDGSSATCYIRFNHNVAEGLYEVGICSRNFELKINEENKNNAFIKTIVQDGYLEHMFKLGKSFAVQGELCGPGIQGNKYKLEQPSFFVFDVFLIDEQRYATRQERWDILQSLLTLGVKVKQVPHLGICKLPESVQSCLKLSEGKSKINPKTEREGVVFKTRDVIEGQVVSFKAISNLYLLQEK